MSADWRDVARATHEGSESGTVPFPQSIRMLAAAGFDAYDVDFRRATRTYYMPDGQSLELAAAPVSAPVAARFDVEAIRRAIAEAQQAKPGYTYRAFCEKVVAAGCAGYLVSILGQRVLYFGRTGETHTEPFPGTKR